MQKIIQQNISKKLIFFLNYKLAPKIAFPFFYNFDFLKIKIFK